VIHAFSQHSDLGSFAFEPKEQLFLWQQPGHVGYVLLGDRYNARIPPGDLRAAFAPQNKKELAPDEILITRRFALVDNSQEEAFTYVAQQSKHSPLLVARLRPNYEPL
jgi:hypothetical protein